MSEKCDSSKQLLELAAHTCDYQKYPHSDHFKIIDNNGRNIFHYIAMMDFNHRPTIPTDSSGNTSDSNHTRDVIEILNHTNYKSLLIARDNNNRTPIHEIFKHCLDGSLESSYTLQHFFDALKNFDAPQVASLFLQKDKRGKTLVSDATEIPDTVYRKNGSSVEEYKVIKSTSNTVGSGEKKIAINDKRAVAQALLSLLNWTVDKLNNCNPQYSEKYNKKSWLGKLWEKILLTYRQWQHNRTLIKLKALQATFAPTQPADNRHQWLIADDDDNNSHRQETAALRSSPGVGFFDRVNRLPSVSVDLSMSEFDPEESNDEKSTHPEITTYLGQ